MAMWRNEAGSTTSPDDIYRASERATDGQRTWSVVELRIESNDEKEEDVDLELEKNSIGRDHFTRSTLKSITIRDGTIRIIGSLPH